MAMWLHDRKRVAILHLILNQSLLELERQARHSDLARVQSLVL